MTATQFQATTTTIPLNKLIVSADNVRKTVGGAVKRDLFCDDEDGWIEGVTLPDRLASEKLEGMARRWRRRAGNRCRSRPVI